MQQDLCRSDFLGMCHILHQKGFVSGPGGNVSCRVGNMFYITPTGKSLGMMREEDIVLLQPDGTFQGTGKPSKEWRMHLACYQVRQEISAVVHVHSTYSVSVSCLKDADSFCAMPAFTPGYQIRVGDLRVLPYSAPGSPELARGVERVISERNSVLLANHGLVTVGKDLETAFNLVEEIEENARIYFILNGKGVSLKDRHKPAAAAIS